MLKQEVTAVSPSSCASCGFKLDSEKPVKKAPKSNSETPNLAAAIRSDLQVKSEIRETIVYAFYLLVGSTRSFRPSTFFFVQTINDFFTSSAFDSFEFVSSTSQFANFEDDNSEYDRVKRSEKVTTWRFGHYRNQSIPAVRHSGGNLWGATFNTIDTHGQFWRFAVSLLPYLFYWDFWRPLSLTDSVQEHSAFDDTYDIYNTRLVGVPRIRQVRVGNRSCVIHPALAGLFNNCYADYSASTEDTSDIRPKTDVIELTAPAWTYRRDNLNMTPVVGRITTYYPGGYMLDLGRNKEEAKSKLLNLRDNGWIQQSTRAVIVDFNLYNPDINLFLICQLVAEMPPTGGVVTSSKITPFFLLSSQSDMRHFVMSMQLVFFICFIYTTVVFAKKVWTYKWKVLFDFWRMIDFLLIVVCLTLSGVYAYKTLKVQPHLFTTMEHENVFVSFDFPANIQHFVNHSSTIALLLVWIKLLRHLTFISTFYLIMKSMVNSLYGMCQFASICFVTIFALGQLGNLFFGSHMPQYQNLITSVLTVLKTSMKELHFDETVDVSVVLAVIFFTLTLFFVPLVLRNLFICLIADSYIDAKSQICPTKDFTVQSYFSGLVDKLLKRTSVAPTKGVEKNAKHHIREALRRARFKDYEIDVFFSKFEVQVAGSLTEREARRIRNELGARRLYFGGDYLPLSPQDFYDLLGVYRKKTGSIIKDYK